MKIIKARKAHIAQDISKHTIATAAPAAPIDAIEAQKAENAFAKL
jgi:hypothetical protein